MKKVLCFGDSNVFGVIPSNMDRYKENERWSGILKKLAKSDFEIVEQGCPNRTCFSENPDGIEYIAYKILPSILKDGYDIIFVALGINDLQFQYNVSLDDIKNGIINLIKIIKEKNKNTEIVLILPSIINENILNSFFSAMFDKSSIEKSKHLSKIYSTVANEFNCKIIDLNKVATVSDVDGLHYTVDEHRKIAEYMYEFLTINF